MPTRGVLKALDLIGHARPGFVVCPVDLPRRALGRHRREEALTAALSQTLSERAYRTSEALVRDQPLELVAGVLAAASGVMQQRVGFAGPLDRHHLSIGDERHPCRLGAARKRHATGHNPLSLFEARPSGFSSDR